jgi:hypothetical protein
VFGRNALYAFSKNVARKTIINNGTKRSENERSCHYVTINCEKLIRIEEEVLT